MARTLQTASYVTKTGAYTARKEDEVILANGTFTVTLYATNVYPGHSLIIKNTGIGIVTVAGNTTGEKIDGSNTTLLGALQSVSLFNDGSNWWKSTVSASAGGAAALINDGNSGASKTIDWNLGTGHLLTLTANCTLSFSNPSDGARFLLLLNSGAGEFLVTWPANVKWGFGGQPLNSQTPSKTDMFTMVYDGGANSFYMSYSLGY
jgi:hypothetical protein